MKIEHMLLLLRQCLYGPLFLYVHFLLHLSQFFILMSMGEGAQHPVTSVPTGLSVHHIRGCDVFKGYCVILC